MRAGKRRTPWWPGPRAPRAPSTPAPPRVARRGASAAESEGSTACGLRRRASSSHLQDDTSAGLDTNHGRYPHAMHGLYTSCHEWLLFGRRLCARLYVKIHRLRMTGEEAGERQDDAAMHAHADRPAVLELRRIVSEINESCREPVPFGVGLHGDS